LISAHRKIGMVFNSILIKIITISQNPGTRYFIL
jgi:hypothetical protein